MFNDFTFSKYRDLCNTISRSGYHSVTVEEYILDPTSDEKRIILRHDVDLLPENSLVFAEIEYQFGLKSTYYFRTIDSIYKKDVILKIKSFGHEIGYHYEVLDKTKGNFDKAITLFKNELDDLRTVSPISTICMHGNSRTPWNNIDIWDNYDFKKFGLKGEAYISIDFSKLIYFTDSARTWDKKYKVKDTPKSAKPENMPDIGSTNDIISYISLAEHNTLYILTHPDEWTDNKLLWTKNLLLQMFKNKMKLILKWWFNKNG